MFQPDALQFRQFYSSPLGKRVMRDLGSAIRRFWPGCGKDVVAGVGFTLPYLGMFEGDSGALLSLMPREQGAIYWPSGQPNISLLTEMDALPVGDNMLNRVLVIHALEHSHHVASVLRELWRVLVPGGRALLIVPNRRGMWAQAAATPFGCGQPYTPQQLKHRTGLIGFTFVEANSALYSLPVSWRWLLAIAPVIELFGRMFLPGAGGVIVMEVEKQIYASIPEPVKSPAKAIRYPSPGIALGRR